MKAKTPTLRSPDPATDKTFTLFMPGEERIFFDYLHAIAGVTFLLVCCLGIILSRVSWAQAGVRAGVLVLPFYALFLFYRRRFADSVTLDFEARKVVFSFNDGRESFDRDFQDIRQVNFRFYLTFIMDDARIMIKRPENKKEVFRLLSRVFRVNQGLFGLG